jgi:gluconokinase
MILIVAGVSGSGKTTVGKIVASRLGWEFEDGDAFHTAASIAKMRAGVPLTDSDRFPWLAAIGAWMDGRIAEGRSAVVACSGLSRKYRDALLANRDQATMAFLEVSREQAAARLHARHGHFFGESMVASQFAGLELPEPGERAIAVPSDRPAQELADHIISLLGLG